MKIAVSSQGEHLDAPASPVFGRCPTYLFVEPETMAFEAVPNPAMNQGDIAFFNLTIMKQAAQLPLHIRADCKQHHSRGMAVEPMHHSNFRHML